ncbi:MAG: hypothetical protein EA402_03125 [Planctomycetota bacterium]|nr:MAG: hypothetical protein EA402_03125 [Planctomycetota bacterium]
MIRFAGFTCFIGKRWLLTLVMGLMAALPLQLKAAEVLPDLFVVTAGSGWSNGEPIRRGDTVPVGAVVHTEGSPLRLMLLGARHARISLGNVSRFRAEELSADGAWYLRLELSTGTIQVHADDLRGSGFQGLVLRGAVMEAEMQGTLFVAQRVTRDADYVALVRGGLRVRDTVAAIDGERRRRDEIDLLHRHGVYVHRADGIGEPFPVGDEPLAKSFGDTIASLNEEEEAGREWERWEFIGERDRARIMDRLGTRPFVPARQGRDEVLTALSGMGDNAGYGSIFDRLFSGSGWDRDRFDDGFGAIASPEVFQELEDPPPPPPDP